MSSESPGDRTVVEALTYAIALIAAERERLRRTPITELGGAAQARALIREAERHAETLRRLARREPSKPEQV